MASFLFQSCHMPNISFNRKNPWTGPGWNVGDLPADGRLSSMPFVGTLSLGAWTQRGDLQWIFFLMSKVSVRSRAVNKVLCEVNTKVHLANVSNDWSGTLTIMYVRGWLKDSCETDMDLSTPEASMVGILLLPVLRCGTVASVVVYGFLDSPADIWPFFHPRFQFIVYHSVTMPTLCLVVFRWPVQTA